MFIVVASANIKIHMIIYVKFVILYCGNVYLIKIVSHKCIQTEPRRRHNMKRWCVSCARGAAG